MKKNWEEIKQWVTNNREGFSSWYSEKHDVGYSYGTGIGNLYTSELFNEKDKTLIYWIDDDDGEGGDVLFHNEYNIEQINNLVDEYIADKKVA